MIDDATHRAAGLLSPLEVRSILLELELCMDSTLSDDSWDTDSPMPAPKSTSSLAVVSLIFGSLGLLCCLPLSLVAVICGHIAHSRISQSQGTLGGSGVAVAGFVTGYVGILVGMLVLPSLILPAVIAGREKANQMACSHNLRLICGYHGQYCGENDRQPTVDELTEYMRELRAPDDAWHCLSSGALGQSYKLIAVSEEDMRRGTPSVVLLRDVGHPHRDGYNACYLDGRVEYIEEP